MYNITDEQIDFILNDIRSKGIETEDLQFNLLDHVCCIIENEMQNDDDFNELYTRAIRRLYKHELKEIEEETQNLLTFKNYYAMQKSMIISGATAVLMFIAGAIFKMQQLPGANVLLVSAIFIFGFLFLPLMFIMKTREKLRLSEKLTFVVACIAGIMQSLSITFHIQRWPYREYIWSGTLVFSFFILVPLYFFTGIRNPATKNNTIITTIIIIGALGMQYAMI